MKCGTAKQANASAIFAPAFAQKLNKVKLSLLVHLQRFQILSNTGVVNAQELSAACGHVRVVMLALGTFAVKELKYRLIGGRLFEVAIHDLKEDFAKMR